MTAETQRVSDTPFIAVSNPTPTTLVEDPATTMKALLAQKAKNKADMTHGVSLNMGGLFPETTASTVSQTTPHFNFMQKPSVFAGSTVLDLGDGSVHKIGEIKWRNQPGALMGTDTQELGSARTGTGTQRLGSVRTGTGLPKESPVSSVRVGTDMQEFPTGGVRVGTAGQKELPASGVPSDKDARELQILRKYFQTDDMTSVRSDYEKGTVNTDLQLDLKGNLYQNSVQADKSKTANESKSDKDTDQTKAKDASKGGKGGDGPAAGESGTTAAAINGTTTVDSNGTKTTTYKDGAVRVEKTDGSGYTMTPKPDGTFVEHKWAKAPEHFWQHDVNKDPDRVLTADQAMKERHDQLVADARANIHDKKELDKFEADLTKLEQRAKKDGVSPAQLAQMYGSVDTLITSTATTPSNQGQRLQLAEQVMSQASDPTRIHQGQQNTCVSADMEVAAYLKHPEAAARLVSDVALTGQYTALDGTTFKVNPQPHGESKLPDDGHNRSHASEIFEVTAVNLAFKQGAKTADNAKDIEHVNYWQTDTGERAEVKFWGKKPEEGHDGMLPPEQIPPAYSAITGDTSINSMYQENGAKPIDALGPAKQFATEAQLDDYLAHAKFPVTITVSLDSEPFDHPLGYGDGTYQDRDNGRGHSLIITGYEPGPPAKVKVFNTDGAAEPMGQEGGGEMTIHDLYKATLQRPDAIKQLQKDIADEKKHGTVDSQKELELVRLQIEAGQLSKKDAARELKTIISHMPDEEQHKDSQRIMDLINALGISDVDSFAPAIFKQ
jgi:hypothetical protein